MQLLGLSASGFQPLSHKTAKNRINHIMRNSFPMPAIPKQQKKRINRINGINRKSFLRFIPFIRFLTVFCGFGCAWSQPLSHKTAKNREKPYKPVYPLTVFTVYTAYTVYTVFFVVLGLPASGFQPLSHKTAKYRKNRIMRNSFPKPAIPKQQKTV